MKRRWTTKAEDAAFLRRVYEDSTRDWKVGDACRAYRLNANTTVASIDGEIVTLANGDRMHITRMRRAE